MLRKIFGSNRDEVTKDKRKLLNEMLHELCITTYYSGNRVKKNMLGGARDTNCRAAGGRIQGFGVAT